MEKIAVQNLAMITTSDCNLSCAHCLRGNKCGLKMQDEVIEATLEQILCIGNLCICGGEPLLALDVLEKIFNSIIKHKIFLDEISLTSNGTIYSTEFLRLLKEMDAYISRYKKTDGNIFFSISNDQYHKAERERLNLEREFIENYKQYKESKYFDMIRTLDPALKLFREGNATNLPKKLTVPLRPMNYVIAYAKDSNQNVLCNIGSIVTVNQEGIITECDASEQNQKTKYNYGNVKDSSIEEIALKRGKVIKPSKWEKETEKLIIKQLTYNK